MEHYQAASNRDAFFRIQLKQMQEAPDIRHYKELKHAAQAVGTWETVQPEIIKQLRKKEQYDVLTRAYLHDQNWEMAWDTLAKTTQSKFGIFSFSSSRYGPLDLEVANQARLATPAKSLPIYLHYVRRFIDQRNRDSYAEAAKLLKTVRELYTFLNDEAGWKKYIEDLKTEFARLPALQDELRKVKL